MRRFCWATAMQPNSETFNLYILLIALDTLDKPGSAELSSETGLVTNTLKKVMLRLRKEYGVVITYHRNSSERKVRGAVGYYTIDDWGVFDRQAVRLLVDPLLQLR